MARKVIKELTGGLMGKTWSDTRSKQTRGYGHPGFSVETRPSQAYSFGKKIYDIRSAGRDAIDDTVESYAKVLAKAQDAKDTFRDSIDETVGTWIDDQKDFWGPKAKAASKARKAASNYLKGLTRGRGKAGSANFNANVRNKAFNKGVSRRNKIKSIGSSARGISRGIRDSIDETIGTWIDDQKDFWKGKK